MSNYEAWDEAIVLQNEYWPGMNDPLGVTWQYIKIFNILANVTPKIKIHIEILNPAVCW